MARAREAVEVQRSRLGARKSEGRKDARKSRRKVKDSGRGDRKESKEKGRQPERLRNLRTIEIEVKAAR